MTREREGEGSDAPDEEGGALSFARFVQMLDEPPSEPCESELQYLTPTEYDQAFDEMLRLYRRRIIGYISRLTDDWSGAHDLAQELFLSLYQGRVSFEKAYIYRAAKNKAYSELRRRGRQGRMLRALFAGVEYSVRKSGEVVMEDPRPLPDAELLERAREEALHKEVERLYEPFRAPLLLRFAGHSYERIAETMQTAKGTVKSRICRGKSILRRRLRAYL